jgi:predicted alpha/beta hydrolase
LRKVGDLPRGVIEQWRRWCLDPDYAYGAEGSEIQAQYAAMNSPITSLSFDDDEFMSARNTELLHGYYRSAARIGHFGFFNARFEDSLWRSYLLPELA